MLPLLLPYCCQAPTRVPGASSVKSLLFIYEHKETRRADLRTADLLITSDHSGVAGVCRGLQCRISRRLSLLRVAACCTVLRSRWYQSGIRTSDSDSLTSGPIARTRDLP